MCPVSPAYGRQELKSEDSPPNRASKKWKKIVSIVFLNTCLRTTSSYRKCVSLTVSYVQAEHRRQILSAMTRRDQTPDVRVEFISRWKDTEARAPPSLMTGKDRLSVCSQTDRRVIIADSAVLAWLRWDVTTTLSRCPSSWRQPAQQTQTLLNLHQNTAERTISRLSEV